MNRLVHCLLHEHQPGLVLVAAAVCTLTAFSVFLILEHARLARTRLSAWASLAGLVSGVGTWATHFIAMLSYDPGVPAAYGPWLTLLSLVAAVMVTGFGWWLLLTRRRTSSAYSAVTVIARDATAREILRSIVGLGRNLGVEVVAAGVETAEQMSVLGKLGCTQVQGVLIGRPTAEPLISPVEKAEASMRQVA